MQKVNCFGDALMCDVKYPQLRESASVTDTHSTVGRKSGGVVFASGIATLGCATIVKHPYFSGVCGDPNRRS